MTGVQTCALPICVEDIAQRGGPDFGYRLTIRKQSADFQLSTIPPYVNVPRGGTALIQVTADRRGYDGPIQTTIAHLPKGWKVDGGYIAEETMDAANLRSFSRRAVMTLTVDPDAELPGSELMIMGTAKLPDGSVLERHAAGPGASIEVASGTGLPDAASTDRPKPFTALWLGLAMPAAIAKEPPATLEVRETGRTRMAQGDAYNFEWKVTAKNKMLAMPANLTVDIPGARDIRVIDMKPDSKGADHGTFTVTTTHATAPVRYDLVSTANLMVDGRRERIVSRAIPFEVLKGATDEGATKITSGSR